MSEIEQFSALVGDIYDASLDPSLWTGVLEKMCAFVPGTIGNIFIQDALAKRANLSFGWGNDPYYEKLYLEKLCKINPLFPGILFKNVGEVFATQDIISDEQMRRTRFYREYVEPQNLGPALCCVLEKSSTSCALLALPRAVSLGPIDEESHRRARLLAPHLQRAILIGKAIDLQKATAEMLAETVNTLTACVYLVDENARIVHANRSGLELLAQDDIVRSANSVIRWQDSAADRALRGMLAAASAHNDLSAAKSASISLAGRNGDRYAVHILPLTSGERRKTGKSYLAVAGIFVQKMALNRSTFPEMLAKQFHLTPAELGVMFSIIEVGGVPEVARVLGLSQATIKTHLGSVFAKTGTRRQADLVKFVVQFANPVAS